MTRGTPHPVLRFIRNLAAQGPSCSEPDAGLLARFVAQRDESAFAALLRRHGPLVWRLCRGLLKHEDAEDAFQAVWLVFLRKGRTLSRPELLGHWLYKVTYRAALTARAAAARRSKITGEMVSATSDDPAEAAARSDVAAAVNEEPARLPEKYQVPLILHYLAGQSQEEIARCLGCPRQTITSRISRGCERMRARLTRRGVTLPLGALTAGWAYSAAAVPQTLIGTTVKAFMGAGAASAISINLMHEVVRVIFYARFRQVAVWLWLAGLLGGATVLAVERSRPGPAEAPEEKNRASRAQWEYKALTQKQIESLAPKGSPTALDDGLNLLGTAGWELATAYVTPVTPSQEPGVMGGIGALGVLGAGGAAPGGGNLGALGVLGAGGAAPGGGNLGALGAPGAVGVGGGAFGFDGGNALGALGAPGALGAVGGNANVNVALPPPPKPWATYVFKRPK